MRIGRYEFGWCKPLKWSNFRKTDEDFCGCTVWEFGFWYFTVLRYSCDTRIKRKPFTSIKDMPTFVFDEDEPLVADVFKPKKMLKKRKDSLKAAVKTSKSLEPIKIKLTKKEKQKVSSNLLKKRKKKKGVVDTEELGGIALI